MALARPPALPGGGVDWVNRVGDRAAMPFLQQRAQDEAQPDQAEQGRAQRQHDEDRYWRGGGGDKARGSRSCYLPLPASSRRSINWAQASTMKVMTNSIRPSSISDEV